jgi:cupin fold WbuC family metalloprotein
MKIVTRAELAALVGEARNAPRRRKNLNLHPTLADPVQRLLNAFEPGSYVRPHRRPPGMAGVQKTQGAVFCHANPDKWEVFTILQGRALVLAFDADGIVQERHELAPDAVPVIEIAAGTWHTLAALESGTLLLEVKPGPYIPAGPQDFAAWAPAEGTPEAVSLERWFHAARVGERAPR